MVLFLSSVTGRPAKQCYAGQGDRVPELRQVHFQLIFFQLHTMGLLSKLSCLRYRAPVVVR